VIRFVKSHGAGNDFVMIEDLDGRLAPTAAFVAAACDRHFGVGADGLIRIARAPDADFFMDYYNADGAVAEMCGNGIRCLAKYVGDRGIAAGDRITVATRAGRRSLELFRGPGEMVTRVRVDMGAPILGREGIPLDGVGDPLHEPVHADGWALDAACVSMGNPHCVVFFDDLASVPHRILGPLIERDVSHFPAGTNVEFVQVLSEREVRARVWERGVGETLACGTGACAIAVAGHLRGYTGRSVEVGLPGGALLVEWAEDDRVWMTGPAVEVFAGTLSEEIEDLLAVPSSRS
jgi:diaminopimelate epimerase